METTSFALWVCAALPGGDLETPPDLVVARVQGPVRETRIGDVWAASSPRIIYANTLVSGDYALGEAGMEWIDWGRIASNADHETVTELSIGYATSAPSTSARVRIYDEYVGHCTERGVSLLDLSLTGLPGSPGGGVGSGGLGWIVSLDLSAVGACFYKQEGSFGYSYVFSDAVSGPLFARGGTGQENRIDWVSASGALCGTLGSGPGQPPPAFWYGLYAKLGGHDGTDTYGVGCGVFAGLGVEGNTCPGGSVTVTANGPFGGPAAFALGVTFGPGIGGPVGDCMLDVLPIVPLLFVGQLGGPPLVFSVDVGLPSGGLACLQFITREPATGRFGLSRTQILNVP